MMTKQKQMKTKVQFNADQVKVPTLFSAFTILSYRNPLYCYIIYLIVLFSLPFLAIVLYFEIYFRTHNAS